MTNRAMDIVPRIVLAGVVASAALTTLHFRPASAADDCIAKPKGVAPAGQHWYYRSDRATKRQCWYLGDEAAHGASLSVRKTAAVVAHRHHQQFSQAAADAHAEFPSPAVPATDMKRDLVVAAPAAMPAAPLADSDAPTERVRDNGAATADQSAVASRWPDATGAVPPAAATTPSRNAGTFAMAAAEPTPPAAGAESVPPATVAAASSVSDTASADTADTSVVATPTADPSRMQLAALLGAVALIGFSTSVLLARARARRRIRLEPVMAQRRPRWPADPRIDPMQLPEVDRIHPALARRSETAPRRAVRPSIVPRDDARYDEQYEVEDLLARYSGQGRPNR
jgi:hypothetical protein